jgi:hypothetical protein
VFKFNIFRKGTPKYLYAQERAMICPHILFDFFDFAIELLVFPAESRIFAENFK